MTIGQFAEIATMAYLGFFLKRLGFRKVIAIGVFAYFARYAIFGTTVFPAWIMVLSQALHGFCYAFFFAAGYIYVDKIADEDVRHSAQTVFGIIILGGGPVIGGWLSGKLQEINTTAGIFDYATFWYTLAGIGLVTALNPYIGYQNATQVAKEALETDGSVYDIVLEKGLLSQAQLDEYLKPENMTHPTWKNECEL